MQQSETEEHSQKKLEVRDGYTRSLLVSLRDPQFGVALRELFCRSHLVAISMFRPLVDKFLQKLNPIRKVNAMSSKTKDVIVKRKPKKNQERPKAKENESDNSTDNDDSDGGNQVSDNEVANVRKKEN